MDTLSSKNKKFNVFIKFLAEISLTFSRLWTLENKKNRSISEYETIEVTKILPIASVYSI
jgi:hypothetical protein